MSKLLITIFITFMFAQITFAERLKTPVGSQAANKKHMAIPERGKTKQDIKRQFGEPQARTSAVGEPPISSWQYQDYVTYFEHDKVIHSVFRK